MRHRILGLVLALCACTLAAALFAGHAHVMYMHNSEPGVEQEQNLNQELPENQQETGRDI